MDSDWCLKCATASGSPVVSGRPRLLRCLLARKLLEALASWRQFGFLGDHHRKSVLDREPQAAPLTDEARFFGREPRVTRVQRTAEDFQQVLADHYG